MVAAAACAVPPSEVQGQTVEEALQFLGPGAEENYAHTQMLVRRCMAEQGFDYKEQQLTTRSFVPYATIGSWTADLAEQYGLGVVTSVRGTFDDNTLTFPNQAYLESASREEAEQWYDAKIQCDGVVREFNQEWGLQVGRFVRSYTDMVHEFLADDRQIALQAQWSRCMAESGYAGYGNLDSLIAEQQLIANSLDPLDTRAIEEAEDAERVVARVVADCAEPLREEWRDVWREYESTLDLDQLPEMPLPTDE